MRTVLIATSLLAVLLMALTTVVLRGSANADACATARCRLAVERIDRRERLLRARLAIHAAQIGTTSDVLRREVRQ